MSHLHIPDGVLPVWLWVSGLALALAVALFSLYMVRGMDLKKKVPLLGMMSAMMLVGMNMEVVPLAYHVNLSVMTAIILGPWLTFIAVMIVGLLMALVGHGGITVLGLNTLVVGSEAAAGYLLFTLFRRLARPGLAAAVSTFLALFMSTCLMLCIVYVANVDFGSEGAHGLREVIESPSFEAVSGWLRVKRGFNFRLFAYVSLGLGALGWSIESLVTAAAVRFINKVRPDLIRRAG